MRQAKTMAKKLGALLLCACMLFSTLGMAPALAAEEPKAPQTIDAFAPLADGVAIQNVTVGTEQSDLNLPSILEATVGGETAEATVALWTAQPEYESGVVGKYVFIPVLEIGYMLASGITLPTVEITVAIADTNDTTAEKEEPTIADAVDSNQHLPQPEDQPVAEVEMPAILESQIQADTPITPFGSGPPVTIGSADDLIAFADNINNGVIPADKDAVLTADINMTGKTWTPIGNFNYRYGGTFNGNNHGILNLTYTTTNSQAGVFGMTTHGAVINNLGVTGIFSGNEYIGGIIGYAEGTTIENCWNGAIITGSGGNIGGLVGSLGEWGNSLIKNCYNYGSINGAYSVGGIVGTLGDNGTVLNCFSYAAPVRSIVGATPWGGPGVTNSYYLNTTSGGNTTLGTAATEEQFKWGEVAWLLNGQTPNGIWKQTFGTDDYPKFTGNDVTRSISKPSVSVIAPAAVNVGQILSLAVPAVDDNGSAVTV